MKKLFTIITACYTMTVLSGCGCLSSALTHGKSSVFLMQSPSDVVVTCNGATLEKTKDVFASKHREHSNGIYKTTTTTSYYATAVKLPHKKKATIELYSPSLNKKATVVLKPKVKGAIIVADWLFTASIGFWIDLPTGNLKTLKPRLIDVESALDGKPYKQWKSQGKLKRMAKRGADKHARKKY